ncbi:serine hydrolase [Phenylobacterium sp. J367]|uniref:serine hydrolase domain-containing protein n=1 Tax=Phenylobacterium sp. J367 TaxID=2898435 RepID=UPI002150E4E3|nr:serine hydrolase [Phenylobacterium sp. J367]MCR5877430.1 beta-lactamase family protein [Phenylobacterium sp. J367]
MRLVSLAAVAALVPAVVQAQAPSAPDAHTRALAAGYKAAFLCSDVFNAGQTPEQIAKDDLDGIYPQYQQDVRDLEAVIDFETKQVSVRFDRHMAPRVAAWRPNLGCAQLPIGAEPEAVANLPRFDAAAPATEARKWPDGDATTRIATPAKLAAAAEKAFDGATYGEGSKTTAVLVLKDGRIVAERYRADFDMHTPQRTWSAAKSLTATVVGRAVQQGLVKVEAPADIPEWRTPGDPRARITLQNLMHMGSGLWTDGPGNRTDEVYVGGGAVTEWATRMPLEVRPGIRFRYANNDTLLAQRAVRAALGDGDKALAYPFQELLWKIGMTHTTPETDWQGNFILSSQVWTTARDLARLALLYQNDGVWNGERLLPKGWAKFVATPAPAQPASGPGYGAFFWLYGPAQGLPEGVYGMNGNRGQYVLIVPSRKVIVVRRGYDPAGKRFDEAKFARDVLAALD